MSVEENALPIYERPPPHQIQELPKEDPNLKFSFKEYWKRSKDPKYKFDKLDRDNDIIRKVIIDEISKCPDIQDSTSSMVSRANYPNIAVAVYKRTGSLLSVATIQAVYRSAKNNLRNRLHRAYVLNRFNPEETEKILWKWDYYPFMRFYRKFTALWEKELQEEAKKKNAGKGGEPNRQEKLSEEEEEDREGVTTSEDTQFETEEDDYVVYETNRTNPQEGFQTMTNIPTQQYPPFMNEQAFPMELNPFEVEMQFLHGDVDPQGFPLQQATQYNMNFNFNQVGLPQMPPQVYPMNAHQACFQQQVQQDQQHQAYMQPQDDYCNGSQHMPSPNLETIFQRDLHCINLHAMDIFREQPHQVQTLRKALFDVVLTLKANMTIADEKELYRALQNR